VPARDRTAPGRWSAMLAAGHEVTPERAIATALADRRESAHSPAGNSPSPTS
jgi:hypothetical protein